MKELRVNCTLYMDMLSDSESKADALDRLIYLLNDQDIAIGGIVSYETQDVEEY